MQKLAEICVRRPVFATMLILTLVVLGIFSYNRLVVERFPRVEFPTITITTRLPGAAPQDDLAGAVGVQLEAGQLPAAVLGLKAQHRRRCGPGRARRDPQRRVLVIRGRLHHVDCACSTPIGHATAV